jgi:hypothetical protein
MNPPGRERKGAGVSAGLFPFYEPRRLLALLGGLATSLFPTLLRGLLSTFTSFLCGHDDLSIHGGSCSLPIPRWIGETTTVTHVAL